MINQGGGVPNNYTTTGGKTTWSKEDRVSKPEKGEKGITLKRDNWRTDAVCGYFGNIQIGIRT